MGSIIFLSSVASIIDQVHVYCALIIIVSGKCECIAHGEEQKGSNRLNITELKSKDDFMTYLACFRLNN